MAAPRKRRASRSRESDVNPDLATLTKAVGDLTGLVKGLADKQDKLQQQVADAQERPAQQTMRVAPKEADLYTEAIKSLTKPGQMVDKSRTMDLLNPRAHLEGLFAEDDVVKLREDSDKAKRIRKSKHFNGEPDVPILGRVLRFMQTDSAGIRKYKVDFRGVGKDGCRETELELIKSAV